MSTELWKPQDHVPNEVKQMLKEPSPNYVFMFLHIVELLKIQRRTGWVDYDISPCESISDHMYRMALISILIKDPNVNRQRCVRISLVHDLAEALVGDITPVADFCKEEKHRREWETIKYLCDTYIEPYNPAAAKEVMNDWLAYENVDCIEARYVKDIDKFEMFLQSFEYERRHKGSKNLESVFKATKNVKTEEVKSWVADLLVRRSKFFESLQ